MTINRDRERLRQETERLTRLSADLAERADKLREHADALSRSLQDVLKRADAADAAAQRMAKKW